ncbi:MAG: hypothetical protein K0S65_3649, partial [Labilithrix sp.]|nr:hypothetical protein [Labilithrix sp.]
MDEDVDTTEVFAHRFDDLLHPGHRCDVRLDEEVRAAASLDERRASVRDHTCATATKPPHDRFTDPARPTRNERAFALEID